VKEVLDLQEEIARLAPWHQDIEVGRISTLPDTHYQPRGGYQGLLRTLYRDGLQGRSVLDCACNAGGYLFWAKELGAGECYGFDIREHWIRQGRFLAEHREQSSEGVRFEVSDLYDLPERDLEPCDVTVFTGIFYHLPDPVRGLKIAADLTRELMVFDTETRAGRPDGLLVAGTEGTEVLSGAYGLNWHPTGPAVVRRVLEWAGFIETCVLWWEDEVAATPGLGRMSLLASKTPGLLEVLNRSTAQKFVRKLSGADPATARHVIQTYCKPDVELEPHSDRDFTVEAVHRGDRRVLARVREGQGTSKVLRWWVFEFEDGDIASIEKYGDAEEARSALARQDQARGA
jgi:tRNA (mo5U34)-methyltransferase